MKVPSSNKDRIAIVDVDDILFYTTSLWYDRIFKNPETFSEYIDPSKILVPYEYEKDFLYVYQRDKYYLSDSYFKPDLTEDQKKEGIKKLMDVFKSNHLYKSDKLLPTSMLFSLKKLLNFGVADIGKAVLVTRTVEGTEEDKIQTIRDYFTDVMSKVDIVIVDIDEKKSDAIKDYDVDKIGLVMDDELNNIIDYLENTDIHNASFYIPEYNYNVIDTENNKKIEELETKKDNTVLYYNYHTN